MIRLRLFAAVFAAVFALSALLAAGSFAQGTSPAKKGAIAEAKDPQSMWVYRQSIALGVPEEELSILVASCQEQGFTTAEVRRIVGLVAKAKLSGLPHEDLLAKLREGLAKRAGPDAVGEAVSAKALTLRRAKDVVDSLIMEGWSVSGYGLSIKMVADAMDFGLSQQKIISVIRGDIPRPDGAPDLKKVFTQL